MIDPQYGIAFTDPAHPGSDESQSDKHRRHKQMRGSLRAAGFQIPAPEEEGLASTARLDTGHTLSFLPYGDHQMLRNWTVEVGHPNTGPRGARILGDIAAGTHEGNIARNQFHPLSLDHAGQEPGEPEASA